MIGSFWNLCRACPSMPVDKLHSEYRSTYRWHEYTGPRQEIVRRAPQPATGTGYNAPTLRPTRSAEEATTESNTGERAEPALPRRKKHPELAYRAHEFLARSETAGSNDSLDSVVPVADRARSEERVPARPRPSRRSKSEGPPQSEYRLQYMKFRGDEDQDMIIKAYQNAPGGNSLSSALSRISTEYRLQFAWPPNSRINMESGPPPKSLSMGAIRPPGISSGHKKHTAEGGEEGASELEPLVGLETTDGPTSIEIDDLLWDEKFQEEILSKEDTPQHRKEINTEYKKKFQPFSQYDYIEGKFSRKKEEEVIPVPLLLPNMQQNDTWYKEVLELRKKAGEYKHRGWGTELVPEHIAELYNKQMTLWEQVSRRSSLSALSLATTTHRSISKEEKDKQNTKKSSPTNPVSSNTINLKTVPIREKLLDSEKRKVEKPEETKKEYPRSRKDYLVRHHLDRTTGATDGSLLQSPTREKLEPVIPVQKDENYQTKSPQKSSPKNSPRSDNQSPKRQTRGTGALAAVHKSHMNGPVQAERRPRPTSLTTTAPSRGKSSLVSLKSDGSAVHPVIKAKTSSSKLPAGVAQSAKSGDERNQLSEGKDSSTEDQILDEINLPSSCFSEKDENEPTVVKSPPEPTRVKSPEQILMKSPEPVNWTVPLDTGKTFTVTQNVHKAGLINRPHSELKAWTPPAEPPPAPQSAPPELLQQLPQSSSEWIHLNTKESVAADVGSEYPGQRSKEEEPASYLTSPKSVTMHEEPTDQKVKEDQGATFATKESTSPCEPSHTVQEHVPPESSQVKVLPAISPSSGQSLAADVLEKARTRFDKFWRKNKESPTE